MMNSRHFKLYALLQYSLGLLLLLIQTTLGFAASPSLPVLSKRTPTLSPRLHLTPAEIQYLQTHPKIRVAIDKDFPPYESLDAHGNFIGIGADYVALIEQRLGIKFQIIADKPWREMPPMLMRGDVDFLATIIQPPKHDNYLLFTQTYIDIPAIIISRKTRLFENLSDLRHKRIAVEENYFMYEILHNNFPDIQVVSVFTPLEGLQKVNLGTVDAYVADAAEANYTISQQEMSDLFSANYIEHSSSYRMATSKNNPLLHSILNKALADISATEKQMIQNRWLSLKAKHGIDSQLLFRYGGIIFVIFASIVTWNLSMRREIQRRKLAETALRIGEERLRMIFQKSQDASFLLINNRIVDCNDACLKMFHCSREWLIGKSPLELSPVYQPDGQLSSQSAHNHIRKTLESDSDKFEWVHLRQDGSEFWTDIVISHININGTSELFAVMRDISKRKRYETELRIAATVFESQEGMMITDANSVILKVNQAFTRITGYSAEDAIGKTPHLLSSGKHDRQFYNEMWGIICAEGSWQGEIFNRRKTGKCYPQWLTITAVKAYSHTEISHYVATFIDITQQKQSERAMRDAELKANLANQAKTAFLANMSHEIRTPLNAIIGMAELTQRTPLNAKQQNYLTKMTYAAHSLLGIINDILDISKIEANKLELEHLDFSLTALLTYLKEMFEVKMHHKAIQLNLCIAPETPLYLTGDRLRLEQVLMNLLSNAIKFTERGQITLTVSPHEITATSVRLHFSVQDSGIGMSAEQLAGLFKPFSQADSSITRKYGGTGLGLSISQKLIHLMKGEITVDSVLGQGSLFKFTALLAIAKTPLLATSAVALPPQNDFASILTGRNILLVEDNEFNQELTRELLTELGMKVTIAENGRKGVEKVFAETFDLVIMDVQMPEMDGLTATRLIRANAKFAQLPILAMTANAMISDKEAVLTAGMNDYIAKPIALDKLTQLLVKLLRNAPPIFSNAVTKPKVRAAHSAPFPATLPPFDIETALLRIRGNTSLLRKLFRIFVTEYTDTLPKLETLLQTGQYSEARRLAHTLKGVAGNLAATELSTAAFQVEQAFAQENLSQLPDLLKTLDKALHAALQAIDSLSNWS